MITEQRNELIRKLITLILCGLSVFPLTSTMASATKNDVKEYIEAKYTNDFIQAVIGAVGWHETHWNIYSSNVNGEKSYGMLQVNLNAWGDSFVLNGEKTDVYKMTHLTEDNNWQYAIDVGVAILDHLHVKAEKQHPDWSNEQLWVAALQNYNSKESNRGVALWDFVNGDIDGYKTYFHNRIPTGGLPPIVEATLIPEPSTYAMFLTGIAIFCLMKLRSRP